MKIFVKYDDEIEMTVDNEITVGDLIVNEFKDCGIIAAKVNNEEVDLCRIIIENDIVELYTFASEYGKHVFWHSSAHVLGNALVNLYGCKLVNGPPIEEGFYYDIDTEHTLGEGDFKKIEKEMMKIIQKNSKFIRNYKSKDELLEMYKENECKKYFISKIDENQISIFYNDDFYDMCMGPHLYSTRMIKAIKITKSSSCYFLNDAKNKSLQRIYGVSFPTKEMMKDYEETQRRAKEMDHRKIGKELDLYFFNDYSPGSCFWLPEGTVIYNRLIEFIRSEYLKRGFKEVITPNMYHIDLWKESGHYQNYKENIYAIEGEDFALKPMNCPGHCVMFRNTTRSYKELPLRLADFGVLHRNECSGSLTGLTRVRRFQQDDAHIFCAKSSIKKEIEGAIAFLKCVYNLFDFKYELYLSTRPEKFLGEIEDWDKAEQELKDAILSSGHTYTLNEGDGAFYGPKIDIILFDAFNRRTQCATIQLDFQLPQRFNLKFINELGELERPVMIHRAILGSVERFVAILVESYGKNMPFWLHPRQIAFCLVGGDAASAYVSDLEKDLKILEPSMGIRIYDESKDTFNKKVRKAVTDGNKIVAIVGEKEVKSGEINIKTKETSFNVKKDDFLRAVKNALETKQEPSFN